MNYITATLIKLFKLLQVLFIAFLIQHFWNFLITKHFGDDYHMDMFQAAILWICMG